MRHSPSLFLSSPSTSEALFSTSQSRKPAVPRAHDLLPLLRPSAPKNHVMENRQAAIKCDHPSSSTPKLSSPPASPSSPSPPTTAPKDAQSFNAGGSGRHKSYGRVPSYLIARKQAWLVAEELKRAALKGQIPGIPPGMRLLTEEERKEALAALDAQEHEIQSMLLKIPLRVDTPSMAKRKQALEARLVEVATNRELFMKPRVLIKEDH